jgi:molybdopterin-guanine dinucleotide biosynthesis protein A
VTCPGILLTGGASRRMGTDKACIVWRGETLAARAARVLAAVCDPVIEAGPGLTGLPCVREEPPGSGPLAALVAATDALGTAGPVLLLACDMPFVDEPVLRLLANREGDAAVIPVAGGRLQLACARYGPAAIARAQRALERGEAALRAAVDADHEELTEEEWCAAGGPATFADLDTPGDLARFGLS